MLAVPENICEPPKSRSCPGSAHMRLSWAAEAEGLEILRWGSSATRVVRPGVIEFGAKAKIFGFAPIATLFCVCR